MLLLATKVWEQRQLGKLFNERKEKSTKGELLSVTLSNGVTKFSDLNKKDNSNIKSGNYKVVKKNDIPYNSMRMWQGASGVSSYDGIVSPAYTVLVPNRNSNSNFYAVLFKKKSILNLFTRFSQGLTSDTWNLKYPILKDIIVPFTNLEEQKRIFKIFNVINNLLALYDRKLKLLSQVKKYFLDNLFAEKEYPNLRFKGFTDAWEQRKLSEMTQQVKRTSDSENPILTISAKNGWMDQKDRFNRVIAGKELKNYIELYKNELSYNHGNSKYAKFGIIYVQRKYEKALVPKVYHSFSMSYGDPRFIESLSLGHKLDKELSKLITSGARQDGLLNINKKSFYTIKLFIPSEQEQIKISNIMDVINHVITLHDNKKQNLIEIKKKLLNTMFI